MNKIIILGNGFDLSHGLKTGFTDFIKYLIRERIDHPDHSNEKLLSIINKSNLDYGSEKLSSQSLDFGLELNQFIKHVKQKAYYSLRVSETTFNWLDQSISINSAQDIFQYKNEFLAEILESENIYTWVDFEKTYYEYLVRDLENHMSAPYSKEDLIEGFQLLNDEFEDLKIEFLKYLQSITNAKSPKPIEGYKRLFRRPLVNYSAKFKGPKEPFARATLILNFNYTNTVDLYNSYHHLQPTVINIHGELNSLANPPIFGYGDEMDPNYKHLESLDNNEALRHFKSFQYSKTTHYHALEKFIESGPYNVDIIGHSCGLSDRVLLNYIFEHENTDTIKIIHHGGLAGHVDTYMNISRHFNLGNKADQRSKVLGFDKENTCPQSK